MGVGKVLKERNPKIQIDKTPVRGHYIQGLSTWKRRSSGDIRSFIIWIQIMVETEAAYEMTRKL